MAPAFAVVSAASAAVIPATDDVSRPVGSMRPAAVVGQFATAAAAAVAETDCAASAAAGC